MMDLSPRDLFERLFKRWYIIPIGIVLGGMAAWLLGSLLPPVYEAHADVILILDNALWVQENHVSDFAEFDLAESVQPVTSLFYSPQVLSALQAAAVAEGLPFDADRLLQDFSIQRIFLTWQMTVRSRDPQAAARLADLWIAAAMPVYEQAHSRALAGFALRLQRDTLAACFDGGSLSAGNTCAGTAFTSLDELQPALGDLDARITEELTDSLGLDPAVMLQVGPPASVPAEPVRFARTWLTLAGAGAGLLLALAVQVGILPPRRRN